MRNLYKVSVWDWRANDYDGAWIIRHVCIRTQGEAQSLVERYASNGDIARWSKHIDEGRNYHYARD